MKKTLTIRIRFDHGTTLEDGTRGVWLATDDVWAYGTGPTPEAAVQALFASLREAMVDAEGEPSWKQGQPYLEWLATERGPQTRVQEVAR